MPRCWRCAKYCPVTVETAETACVDNARIASRASGFFPASMDFPSGAQIGPFRCWNHIGAVVSNSLERRRVNFVVGARFRRSATAVRSFRVERGSRSFSASMRRAFHLQFDVGASVTVVRKTPTTKKRRNVSIPGAHAIVQGQLTDSRVPCARSTRMCELSTFATARNVPI